MMTGGISYILCGINGSKNLRIHRVIGITRMDIFGQAAQFVCHMSVSCCIILPGRGFALLPFPIITNAVSFFSTSAERA